MADGKITIEVELGTKSFDAQIKAVQGEIDGIEEKLSKAKELKLSDAQIDELILKLEKANNKLVSLNEQKNKLGNTATIDDLGKSFEKAIKKVGKLALGIFGIRSAYMAVRRASSDLASYDEQYATNLEYIRFVLTQAIAPIIKWIVNMAMKLLQLINAISIGLFGVNLFSKGSAENFNKMKKGANGVEKAVKGIKKQLMGFDEVNVLSSQSDTGTGVGAGGVGLGDITDLSEPTEGMKKLIKFIQDAKDVIDKNKDAIIGGLLGIAGAIWAIKNGADILQTSGLFIFLFGVGEAIGDIIDYIKDPSWEKFGEIIQDIGFAVAGLGLIFKDWKLILFAIILEIVGYVIKHWDEISEKIDKGVKEIKGFFEEFWSFIDWLDTEIYNRIVTLLITLKNYFGGWISELLGTFTGLFWGIYNSFSYIINGMIKIFQGDFVGGLIQMGKGLANFFIAVINFVISAINTLLYPLRALIVEAGRVTGKNWTINTIRIPTLPYLKVGGIVNMPNKGVMLGGAVAGESRSRGRNSFDRYASYGNIRSNNRKIHND